MTISTHVLDTSLGRPAASMNVRLQRMEGDAWVDVSRETTNGDGRVAALVPADSASPPGTYRLLFDAGVYFARRGSQSFYGTVTIEFMARDAAAHYHVPLLLSPFGYSTYRGS
jgi:5-hydroxyisourate hydrolase